MSHDPQDDLELERFLARNTELQRRWREHARDEPPAEIDAALRAAARRAVGAGPRSLHAPFSGRWRVPLSIAAVVVVSATVSLMIAERREHLPATLDRAPARTPDVSPGAAAPAGAPQAPPSDESPFVPAPAQREATRLRENAAPSAGGGEGKADAREKASSFERDQGSAPGAVAPATPRPVAPAKREAADVPPAAPEAPMQQPSRVQSAPDLQLQDDVGMALEKSAPAAPAAAAPSSAGPADSTMAEPAATANDARRERAAGEGRRADEPAAAASPPPHEHAAAAAPAATREAGLAAQRDAERWLEDIRALLRAGKRTEASESLRKFRLQHPDHRIPPDLQALQ